MLLKCLRNIIAWLKLILQILLYRPKFCSRKMSGNERSYIRFNGTIRAKKLLSRTQCSLHSGAKSSVVIFLAGDWTNERFKESISKASQIRGMLGYWLTRDTYDCAIYPREWSSGNNRCQTRRYVEPMVLAKMCSPFWDSRMRKRTIDISSQSFTTKTSSAFWDSRSLRYGDECDSTK